MDYSTHFRGAMGQYGRGMEKVKKSSSMIHFLVFSVQILNPLKKSSLGQHILSFKNTWTLNYVKIETALNVPLLKLKGELMRSVIL